MDELRRREALDEIDDAIAQTYDVAKAIAYVGLKGLDKEAMRIAKELKELRRYVEEAEEL